MEQNFFQPQSEEPPLEGEGDSSLQNEARNLIKKPVQPLILGQGCCGMDRCTLTHDGCLECKVCKDSLEVEDECQTRF